MKVNLRVTPKDVAVEGPPKRGRPKKKEPIYTPAVVDATKIDFAFIDENGDINIRFAGTDDYYAIQNTDNLFDDIVKIVEGKSHRIRGLGK